MQLTPFWTDQTPVPQDLPRNDLPATADVVVVGSGVTGLNAAIELAKAGVSVVVLEAQADQLVLAPLALLELNELDGVRADVEADQPFGT